MSTNQFQNATEPHTRNASLQRLRDPNIGTACNANNAVNEGILNSPTHVACMLKRPVIASTVADQLQ
jgi:hypothetical protein